MRSRPRVDANHAAVVQALRKGGARVLSLAAVGNGAPDLLCSVRGVLVLVEVKDGAKPPSAQAYTAAQVEFHRNWSVYTVRTLDDVAFLLLAEIQS